MAMIAKIRYCLLSLNIKAHPLELPFLHHVLNFSSKDRDV